MNTFTWTILDITPIQTINWKYEKRQIVIESDDEQTFVADIFGRSQLDAFDAYSVKKWDTVEVHYRFTGKSSKDNRRFQWVTIDNIIITKWNMENTLFSDDEYF